jgi:hypothetical protein
MDFVKGFCPIAFSPMGCPKDLQRSCVWGGLCPRQPDFYTGHLIRTSIPDLWSGLFGNCCHKAPRYM